MFKEIINSIKERYCKKKQPVERTIYDHAPGVDEAASKPYTPS